VSQYKSSLIFGLSTPRIGKPQVHLTQSVTRFNRKLTVLLTHEISSGFVSENTNVSNHICHERRTFEQHAEVTHLGLL